MAFGVQFNSFFMQLFIVNEQPPSSAREAPEALHSVSKEGKLLRLQLWSMHIWVKCHSPQAMVSRGVHSSWASVMWQEVAALCQGGRIQSLFNLPTVIRFCPDAAWCPCFKDGVKRLEVASTRRWLMSLPSFWLTFFDRLHYIESPLSKWTRAGGIRNCGPIFLLSNWNSLHN